MPSKQPRLTAVFAVFVAAICKLGHEVAAACAAAVRAAIGEAVPGSERVLGGQTFVNRPVGIGDLAAGLESVLPRDYAADVRTLSAALGDEAAKRGQLWAKQCLADALELHVVAPLEAHAAGGRVKVATAPKAAGKPKRAA